jgi:ubiquinone/menaquinone biosynthesis C-methylase UbiE
MTDDQPSPAGRDRAQSFGQVADAYDRGRPGYPAEAATWLVGGEARVVLELGAGTGKLTAQLVALGHDVHATDPDPEMLKVLSRHLPDVRVSEASAEAIPLPDRSVDVVVAAQSFHWFDHDVAMPEIARVLKPGGHLAVAWNVRNARIPWVRKLGNIIGSQEQLAEESAEPLVLSPLFGFVEDATFTLWQDINRESLVDLVLSRSNIATLDPDARAAKVAEVLAFYDDYGRGMDGMQLPYNCLCFKAVVAEQPSRSRDDAPEGDPIDLTGNDTGRGDTGPEDPPSDGTDTDMLLIDFR